MMTVTGSQLKIYSTQQDTDSQFTHSPIVLIPFDDSEKFPDIKLPNEVHKNSFTILDSLSPTKVSDEKEKVITNRDNLVTGLLTSLKGTNKITEDKVAQEKSGNKNIIKMENFDKRPKFPLNEGNF